VAIPFCHITLDKILTGTYNLESNYGHRVYAAAAGRWISETLQAMKPYVGQGSYINDVDPILATTPLWPTAYYGDNLAKYQAVKTR
jgi:hypothetical protein